MKQNGQKTFGKSFIKIGPKGQEEGPFELLVAVVLMTFVIFIGLQAMDALRVQTCQGKAEKAMQELQTAVESSVNRNSFTQVLFDYEKCFRPNKDVRTGTTTPEVLLYKKSDPKQCRAICGGTETTCSFLRLENEKFTIDKCLNIPYNSDLSTENDSCTIIEGFEKINFSASGTFGRVDESIESSGIEPGYYSFVPASTTETYPVVCVYVKDTG
ncbi:MAG: hypothetical protein Q7S21_02175 [archaeon]|nr:hypothetical protein [archaeon]